MKALEDGYLQTPFGILSGVASYSTYGDGTIKDVILDEKNMVLTHAGELVPFFTETPRRKYKASLTFFRSGLVKSVELEEQQEITTPIGEFPAELVTFYETGELHRFFPLNGKISGFWSEKDEKALNIPFSFEFDFGAFTAMLVGVCFYKSGDIKSITLFPGEDIALNTPCGLMNVKNGFSLFENGNLESVEPAFPSAVKTPIGKIVAFDAQAVGINADSNSLTFTEDGQVASLITSGDSIAVQLPDGMMKTFSPVKKTDPLDDENIITVGMSIVFDYKAGTADVSSDGEELVFSISECPVTVIRGSMKSGCSPDACAGCSGCS